MASSTDISRRINEFIEASNSYRTKHLALTGEEITSSDIQNALLEVLGIDDPIDLLSRNWNPLAVERLLSGYHFPKLHPEQVDEVVLKASVIPPGVLVDLVEETIRALGERWVIHKNDADPFPSNPHAHCPEKGLKLHLGTGVLFRRKQIAGKVVWKDLLRLRKQIRYRPLPDLDRRARASTSG